MPVAMSTGSGPSKGPSNTTASGLSLGFLGDSGMEAASPGFLEGGLSTARWGLLPGRLLQGAFLSQGTGGCLLGPCSQTFLRWRPCALASKAFLKWGSSHAFLSSEPWGLLPPESLMASSFLAFAS